MAEDPVRATLISWEELAAATRPTAKEFVALVAAMPSQRADERVPGMDWTAKEVAAHVITVLRRGSVDTRRAPTLDELRELNARCIAELSDRNPARLAELLGAELMASAAAMRDPDQLIELHMGVVADRTTASSYFLADLLLHGLDISRATLQPWTVNPGRAAVCLRGLLPGIRPWVRPDVIAGPCQQVTLGLGDGGQPVRLRVGEGQHDVTAGDRSDKPFTDANGATVLCAFSGRGPATDPVLAQMCGWYLPA